MNLFKILIPIVIIKKIYAKPYSAQKKQHMSDEEKDALEDAQADQD